MIECLTALWLPVLAAAAAVWIASAVVWMALPHHRRDQRKLPDEDLMRATLKAMNVAPGVYGFPHFNSHSDASKPECKQKWESGPNGHLTVFTPKISMGKNMLVTFVVYVVVSAMIGYLGWITVPRGAEFGPAFQVLGTAGVLAYAFAFIPGGVWFQHGRATILCVIDGIGYGLITGAAMAALWPAA